MSETRSAVRFRCTVHLTHDDLAIVEALSQETGIKASVEIVRLAMRNEYRRITGKRWAARLEKRVRAKAPAVPMARTETVITPSGEVSVPIG